ncbi:MAG: hypothetical protein ACJ71U_14735 [Terriglobales bacterium]
MAQRGRPKLNGVTKLQRDLTVVWSYNESRRAGEKHASAVASAASEVRKQYPGMKVSETEVKRVLARFQPKGYPQVFTVNKLKNGFGVGFGPRPEHTRINARKRPAATTNNRS